VGLKPLPVVAMHLALGFCSVGLWKWGRNRVDLGVPAAEGLPPCTCGRLAFPGGTGACLGVWVGEVAGDVESVGPNLSRPLRCLKVAPSYLQPSRGIFQKSG